MWNFKQATLLLFSWVALSSAEVKFVKSVFKDGIGKDEIDNLGNTGNHTFQKRTDGTLNPNKTYDIFYWIPRSIWFKGTIKWIHKINIEINQIIKNGSTINCIPKINCSENMLLDTNPLMEGLLEGQQIYITDNNSFKPNEDVELSESNMPNIKVAVKLNITDKKEYSSIPGDTCKFKYIDLFISEEITSDEIKRTMKEVIIPSIEKMCYEVQSFASSFTSNNNTLASILLNMKQDVEKSQKNQENLNRFFSNGKQKKLDALQAAKEVIEEAEKNSKPQ